jgi:hypothetical protein
MPKCRICKKPFVPSRPLQPVCSDFECSLAYGVKLAEKSAHKRDLVAKRAIRDRKVKLKTRSDVMKEAQKAFNAYIRWRDKSRLCICCNAPLTIAGVGGGYDCGHYRSVGSAPHLRFDEANAHGQTKKCNRWGSGRAVDYRIGLIARIGQAEVDRLESDNASRKWTKQELEAIRDTYRQKLKGLKNGNI